MRNQHFGAPEFAGYRVITILGVRGPADVASLLRAVEAGLRQRPHDARLRDYRLQLLNMRFRAWLEDWSGWA